LSRKKIGLGSIFETYGMGVHRRTYFVSEGFNILLISDLTQTSITV